MPYAAVAGFVLLVAGLCTTTFFTIESAAAEACPNEALRAEDPYSTRLPDCRADEQVTPVEKNLGVAFGSIESVRVAPGGEAVTFNSFVPFPVSVGSNATSTTYMGARGADAWSTQGLDPGSDPGATETEVVAVTEDLQDSFILSKSEPPLTPGAVEGLESIYLREDQTGAFRLLFQLTPEQREEAGPQVFKLVASADSDSRIFFESYARLLPEASRTVPNLYEWHEGQLALVDVLPGGDPPSAGAAAGRPLLHTSTGHGFEVGISEYGSRVISEDGSRVFFTDLGTGRLYVREPQADRTVAVSEGAGSPVWLAASPDGTQVFYGEPSEFSEAGRSYRAGALYRFDVENGAREALTPASSDVLGVAGIGGDGSYVYFVAEAVLARGASPGGANLYLWHEGVISLIAGLDHPGEGTYPVNGDSYDWSPYRSAKGELTEPPDSGQKGSRVSADGRTLLFTSGRGLTGYENAGHTEAYIYSAVSGRLRCVSCNPSGVPASSNVLLYQGYLPSIVDPHPMGPERLPRNLSEDGSRAFFETAEALTSQDTNSGQSDVYEWESETTGTCPAGRSEGCVYLISSGTSGEPSYFAGASASGDDVFIFTGQALVGQDNDELEDVYDAREGGGITAQNASAPVAPCQGEACRPAQTPVPALGVPVSQVFSGPGDLTPPPVTTMAPKATTTKTTVKCAKGRKRSHGKCVKSKKSKKATKAAKHGRKRP